MVTNASSRACSSELDSVEVSVEQAPKFRVRLKRIFGSLQICRDFERTCWQPCGRKRTFSDQEKQRPVINVRKNSKEGSDNSRREPSSSQASSTFSVSTESMEFIDKGEALILLGFPFDDR